jgi:phosphoserine phosphatase RsbU/P
VKLKKLKLPNVLVDDSRKKLVLGILFTALLLYKVFFYDSTQYVGRAANEILVAVLLVFLLIHLRNWVREQQKKPLRLIQVVLGIYLLWYLVSMLTSGMAWEPFSGSVNVYLEKVYLSIMTVLVALIAMLVLTIFRELSYLKQKGSSKIMMRAMQISFVVLFLACAFTGNEQVQIFLYYLSGATIFANSLRVAWIAFLTRKEKVILLFELLFLLGVLGGAISESWSESYIPTLLLDISPGLLSMYRIVLIYGAFYLGGVFLSTLFNIPTTEVFERKKTEADSLKDLNRLQERLLDFEEMADAVTRMTARVCHSTTAWLVTGVKKDFRVDAAEGIQKQYAETITRSILEAGAVNEETVTMLHEEVIETYSLQLPDGLRLKTIAIAPLRENRKTTGYLFAGCKDVLGFDDDDRQTVRMFAGQAALALERAKLLDERLEKEKLLKEMELAREIQQKILPQRIPEIEKLDIAAYFSPAHEVGGDYYDIFEISPQKIGVVVADVAGKGISASLIMAEVKGIFESLACIIDSPAKLLARANEILKRSLGRNRFVTVVYGVLDIERGVLRFARAGHPPVLKYSETEGKVQRYLPKGIGLGMVPEPAFAKLIEETEISLRPGDMVVLYTDGISESQNEAMEDFGLQRLEARVIEGRSETATQLVQRVNEAVSVFSRNQPQHDDITLMILKWKG